MASKVFEQMTSTHLLVAGHSLLIRSRDVVIEARDRKKKTQIIAPLIYFLHATAVRPAGRDGTVRDDCVVIDVRQLDQLTNRTRQAGRLASHRTGRARRWRTFPLTSHFASSRFLPRDALQSAVLAVVEMSVRLSVCPPVTVW